MKKHLIAVDGIDGVGKSTFINNLSNYLSVRGVNVKVLAFPCGKLRESMFSGKLTDTVTIATAVRDQTIELTQSVHAEVILIDRCTASAYVYQYCVEKDPDKKVRLLDVMDSYPHNINHIFLYASNVEKAMNRVPDAKKNRWDAASVEVAQDRQRHYLEFYSFMSDSRRTIMFTDTHIQDTPINLIWRDIQSIYELDELNLD